MVFDLGARKFDTEAERAETLARTLIDAHQEPPMATDRRAALDEFVERRVAEGGVETDY